MGGNLDPVHLTPPLSVLWRRVFCSIEEKQIASFEEVAKFWESGMMMGGGFDE